ncbi:uncharacterized protein FMAN_06527 [Fusarium mangiferae]|uniref:Acetyltransferase BOT5 n=1 Tax=Fusarium mangiferae TaxID=192010 RepID=A0A1L7SHR5_FUSMA|nr:uncharacterized protein FMAN_06527 [Fusarium mangiferae]CVK86061.1 uncharacterized protein FMAN_06527 [Fusarium mangiferae]
MAATRTDQQISPASWQSLHQFAKSIISTAMAALLNYLPFTKKEEQRPLPDTVESDDIIPVHLFDDTAAARGIVLVWTLQFEDVLNPHKLNNALSKLFELDGWRRLGGRFRQRSDGGLEIHVPRKFTEDRPAVYFTQEEFDTPMSEHPLASRLPKPTGSISTYTGPKGFCALGLRPETPRNMDDFVHSDIPQFCLHVQTFTDGTLVNLTFSHVTTDLMGLSAIFEGWSQVLAGKPEAVIPMPGYRKDVFDDMLKSPPKEQHLFADKILDGWRFKVWGLRSLYESWRSGNIQSRTLCIPKETVSRMMQRARGHLEEEATDNKPFISEGDVFAALSCLMLAKYQGRGTNRELATIMAVDPRSRARSVFLPDKAYVQNSPTNAFVFCRANEILDLPLGKLALQVRKAIQAQTTEEQLKASTALSIESMKTKNMPVVFGSTKMAAQFMSNWSKGDLAEKLDFSPAIEQEVHPESRRGKRGHPVYYQASDPGHNTVSAISSVFVVVGKDYEGNTWFSNSLPQKMWTDLMDYLEQLSHTGRGSKL